MEFSGQESSYYKLPYKLYKEKTAITKIVL